jgi:pimeloyl-ACP methyl ester carboxylesterase
MLVLQAPYYSGEEAVKNNYPFLYAIIPSFLLKYKLNTGEFVGRTKAPIAIFHGNNDSTFSISQAYKLKKLFKPGDELIVLNGQGHNGFTENPEYIKELKRVLSKQKNKVP